MISLSLIVYRLSFGVLCLLFFFLVVGVRQTSCESLGRSYGAFPGPSTSRLSEQTPEETGASKKGLHFSRNKILFSDLSRYFSDMNRSLIFGNIISIESSLPQQNPRNCQTQTWVLWKKSRFQKLGERDKYFRCASDSQPQFDAFTLLHFLHFGGWKRF